MKTMDLIKCMLCLVFILAGISLSADEPAEDAQVSSEDSIDTQFGLKLGFGVQSFPNPDYNGGEAPKTNTYQSIRLAPDLQIGNFGAGLDLTLNYNFTGDHNTSDGFTIRQEDWIPDADQGRGVFDIYLPKIRYVSWGRQGDPLYAAMGTLSEATLGNGFIMGNYSNALFFPDRRFFGLHLNVDGALFDFPVLGLEYFAGNLARLDVMGGRLYARPMVYTGVPLLINTQFGVTGLFDRDPYFIARTTPESDYFGDEPDIVADPDAFVRIAGLDVRQPILENPVISLAVFGDVVAQDQSIGSMVGTGGRLMNILPFSAQLRFLGANFHPVYFNRTYDLYRVKRYEVYSGAASQPGYMGWHVGSGLILMDEALHFSVSVSGPVGVDAEKGLTPELEATLTINEGIIPGLSLNAFYQKESITAVSNVFSFENAVIGTRINYRTGPAVITLLYDVRYNPYSDSHSPWQVTSGLETTLSLF